MKPIGDFGIPGGWTSGRIPVISTCLSRHVTFFWSVATKWFTANPGSDAKKLLDACAERVNRKMLGYTPPEEMRRKKSIAWVIVLGMLALIAVVVTRQVRAVARSYRQAYEAATGKSATTKRSQATGATGKPVVARKGLTARKPAKA